MAIACLTSFISESDLLPSPPSSSASAAKSSWAMPWVRRGHTRMGRLGAWAGEWFVGARWTARGEVGRKREKS